MNILIWLYRSIPLIMLFAGFPVLELFGANQIASWSHIVLSSIIVYPVVKLESRLFPNNR